MNRFAILGAMGVAVIVAALLLNYAINRDEVADNNAPAPTVAGAPAETPTVPATTTPPAGQTATTGGTTTGSGATSGSVASTGTTATTPPATTPSAITPPPTTPGAPAAGTPPAPGSSGVVVPTFDIVRVNPDGGMVIAGRAAPHSTVTVTADNQKIGSIVADDRGEWVLLPDTKLAPGNHQLASTAQLDGGTAVASDDVVVVVVPQPQVASTGQPTGQTQTQTQTTASNQPTQPLAVVVPRNNQNQGSTVLQAPAPPQSGLLILQSVDYDTDGKLIIGGQAPPGEEVRAYLDNRYFGVAKADQAGRWRIKPEDLVAPGLHTLRIDEVDANGKVVARVESPFSRAQPVDIAAGDQVVVVQPGNSLWLIASRTYGSGFRYTVIYQANKGQISDPDLIYPGQVFKLPTTTQ